MTDADHSANGGMTDEDEAAIDEALEALTVGTLTAAAEDSDDVDEDPIGEEDMFDDPDEDAVAEAGVPDDDAADDVIAAAEGVTDITPVPAPIDFTEPGLGDDAADLRTPPAAVAETATVAAVASAAGQERIDLLEQVATALTAAMVTRENGRVRRKVSASAIGAALASAIPVLLQLIGTLDLSPELAATLSAAAATVASFLTGYATPERKPTLQPELVHEVLKQP